MGYRNYGVSAGFTVSKDGSADFATIAAAITAAGSGPATIYIKDGTYTENLTLQPSINLVAWDADALTPAVTISGKATFTQAGSVSISGIRLQTNSDFCLAVTGSAASVVNLTNCFINCSNNTGISYTSSSGSSAINISYCSGDLGTTGIGLYSASGAGTFKIIFSRITNSGLSTTATSTSATAINWEFCTLFIPLSTSSTGIVSFVECHSNTGAINTAGLTTAGTGTSQIDGSTFLSGTASAISIGAGTSVNLLNATRIDSTNTNAITGAGTLAYGEIIFTGTSSTVNTTTVTRLISKPTFSTVNQVFTGTGTYTPTAGMVYCQITCIGGGGAGGGAAATAAGQCALGGGGGAGEYAVGIFSAASIGASKSVTIGAGGTAGTAGNNPGNNGGNTSVGSTLISANGGTGGNGSGAASANQAGASGGAGGTGGTGGDYRAKGVPGYCGVGLAATGPQLSGQGASSQLGSGGLGLINANGTGNNATGYGSGGSAGAASGGSGAVAGGTGSAGVVIVQEYILS